MPLFCDVHMCVSGLFRSLYKLISLLGFLHVAAFVLEAFFTNMELHPSQDSQGNEDSDG
jgi:hypothetical protein